SLAAGWIWPLPINIPDEAQVEARRPVPGRIVSIGRLTKFKTYSWYLVPILHALRERHPDVQWHVYGSGMCQQELINDIWKDAIEDGLIVFHGPLPYDEMAKAFAGASVFIGMGTAILEAAAAGVPTIPALVDDTEAVSWGFIDRMPYFTVGETVPGMNPHCKVFDLLDEVLGGTPEQVAVLAAAGRRYVEPYSMDHLVNRFLERASQGERGRPLPLAVRARFLAIRFLKLLRNLHLSFARRGQAPIRHAGGDRLLH
ncbi:MAG TPA: glycosyltransferase, partial [Luteolibacter sp.]